MIPSGTGIYKEKKIKFSSWKLKVKKYLN
jgi:hypothetical protein